MISLFQWCWQCLKSMTGKAHSSPAITEAAAAEEEAEAALSPWDRLPDEVVAKIFSNLRTGDRVRMRLVCKSWRSMLMREDIPVAPEAPWLIVSNDSYSNPEYSLTEICFKSLSDGGTYRFRLPLEKFGGSGGRRWCCCGSSGGWLLIAGGCDERSTDMFLWNPVSGATRKLPAMSNIPFLNDLEDEGFDKISSFIVQMQVYFPITGSAECVVVAVLFLNRAETVKPSSELAICTPQDESWTVRDGGRQLPYRDILFHDGKLYVCCESDIRIENTSTNGDGTMIRKANYNIRLSGCDVEVHLFCPVYEDVRVGFLEGLDNIIGFNIQERVVIVENLVESSTTGELLAVSAILDMCWYIYHGEQGPIKNFQCTQTRKFEVRRWAGDCLERLSDIGDQGIFVGATGSLSVKASIDGVEANRIYFATNNATGLVGLEEHEAIGLDEHVANAANGDAAENRDPEDALNEVDVDDNEEEEGDEVYVDPDCLYVLREQGVFDVQQNRIQTTSLTNLCYKLESYTGWFTPRLFQH